MAKEFGVTEKEIAEQVYGKHQIDHIQTNKLLCGKSFTTYSDQMYQFLRDNIANRSSWLNLEHIRKWKQNKDRIQRRLVIKDNRKWEVFKEKRQKVILRYIDEKRKGMRIKQYLTMMVTAHFKVQLQFLMEQHLMLIKRRKNMLNLITSIVMAWSLFKKSKCGRTIQEYKRRKIKNSLGLAGLITTGFGVHAKAKAILVQFVLTELNKIQLKKCVLSTYNNIIYIQRKLKNKKLIHTALREMLINYWSKILTLLTQAQKKNDKAMNELLIQIGAVNKDVRDAALDTYLVRTMKLHIVAFFQWRLLYPPSFRHEYYEQD